MKRGDEWGDRSVGQRDFGRKYRPLVRGDKTRIAKSTWHGFSEEGDSVCGVVVHVAPGGFGRILTFRDGDSFFALATAHKDLLPQVQDVQPGDWVGIEVISRAGRSLRFLVMHEAAA